MKSAISPVKILLLVSFCLLGSVVAQSGEFWGMEPCEGYHDQPYLRNIQVDFEEVPTSGKATWVNLSAEVNQSFYGDHLRVLIKQGFITLFNANIPEDTYFNKGETYTRREYLPTKWATSGTFTGRLSGFNEFGDEILCFNYWVKVRK